MTWVCIGLCWLFFVTCTTSSTVNISKKADRAISSATASMSISAFTVKLESLSTESSTSYKKDSEYESRSREKCQSDESQSSISSWESSEISRPDRDFEYESSSRGKCQSDESQSSVSSCEWSEISHPDREKFCAGKPNEEYTKEKKSCPPEICVSLVSRYDCSDAPPPSPGCACQSGYLRLNETSPCIAICDCPEMASSLDCLHQKPTCEDSNEEFVLEKSTCPGDTCEALVARYDCSNALPPKPGCTCKSGYRRLSATSQCVPICDCPQMAHSVQCQKPICKDPNEEYVQEKSTCPPETCFSIIAFYDCQDAPPPSPGCACKPGYLRLNETSPCIPSCQCPQLSLSPECQALEKKCKDRNEEFVLEKSICPGDTCEALVARYDCSKAPPPKPGCTCKSGYRRLNATSQCVPLCDCPQMAYSVQCQKPDQSCKGPNEEYVQEKRTCPPEQCFSILADIDCRNAPPPSPGCACKSGYLRLNESSPCIPTCQCPELSSSLECQGTCKDPNEEFVQEKSICPGDTCEALVARYDCSKAPPPKPGCTCKSGYRRLSNTAQCVPICDCPQMANSAQCQKPKPCCKGRNEEYVQEKRTCPPETCFSIVAKFDCRNATAPSPGCACKSGYLRLNETSPCIPTCQCPELSSSPECQALEPKCKYPNEEFVQEKSICPGDTCEALVARYDCSKAPPPKPGCTCKSGYRRLSNTAQCVPICDCPQMANSAQCQKPKPCCKGRNEEYVQEKRTCPPETCFSIVAKFDCRNATAPSPGCACKSGYLRLNETSPCIPTCQCPELSSSPECQALEPKCKYPNEEFVQEKSTCPGDTCEALVARYDCSKAPPPKPGCTCKSGFRRLNATSQCVPICDCPQMSNSAECQKPKPCCKGPNEEYVQEKRNCPPETCISIVARYDCSKFPPPKPGCACKSGYLRLNASSPCIPMCKCPQIANTLDCLNKSCKGPNEEFVQEKSTCPGDTCEALVARYDCSKAPPPKPGCTCKSGFRRLNATSQCVPICDCPQMSNSAECQKPKPCCKGPNEEYVQEKRNCPPETCISIVARYDCSKFPPPKPGCACKSGYLRLNASSPCIPMCKCPQIANTLDCLNKSCKGPNEEFVQEKSICPGDTCEALVARYDCSEAPPPKPGCTCKSGFRRLNATSQCVPICDCPQMSNSAECQKPKPCCKGPNEEYVQEKRNCPSETCISIVARYDCSKFPPPKPGCACKSGYLRLNASSPCIPMCKCPQIANTLDCLNKSCKGPNEEFVQEKSTCPGDTCEALVARYDCSKAPSPKPGCTCKSGFRRLNATSQCVPICDCPQMSNSAECQKPKPCCKGPNEEYVQEKRNCPPETCISIVARYDCSKFPPPKPGCACKSGYLRLNASSPCIPMCKCPQIANTLDCLNKSCKGPNEEFVQEKSTCPGDTCEALVARYDCSKAPPPKPGCTCKSGFRRLNATSQCVPICDCPQMSNSAECQKPKPCCKGPNEEYVQEKRNCPPETCISIVARYDCSKFPPPKPGCACKAGYLRLNASSPCIPMCKCPQIANSLDCLKKSCKGPNEEFVVEKRSCPPETCVSLVARINCANAPAPKPGCACKSGYLRLNETSTCIPACDCPQMASAPQCQSQEPPNCID